MAVQSTLVLGALVALAHSKAIVTNLCQSNVYLWSVPEVPSVANNLVLKPGASYEEPFRFGTEVNPGIAIKVSPHPNGIYGVKDEIDFAYNVDRSDNRKVWVSLELVRGDYFKNEVALFTCYGPYKSPYVPTRQCSTADDIELTLCGTEQRSGPDHDNTHPDVIGNCSLPLARREGERTPSLPSQCMPQVVGPKNTTHLTRTGGVPKHSNATKLHSESQAPHKRDFASAVCEITNRQYHDLCTEQEVRSHEKDFRSALCPIAQLIDQTKTCDETMQILATTADKISARSSALYSQSSTLTSRKHPQWTLGQTCGVLSEISGFKYCFQAIDALQTHTWGRKPEVNIGRYVKQALPHTRPSDVVKNLQYFKKEFGGYKWSDDEGSGTDYGWPAQKPRRQVEEARHPKFKGNKTAACQYLGKMAGLTPYLRGYHTSDCDEAVLDIVEANESKHGKKAKKPKVYIGDYVDTKLGREKHQTQHREHVQAALDKFWDEVNWSDGSGDDKSYRPWALRKTGN